MTKKKKNTTQELPVKKNNAATVIEQQKEFSFNSFKGQAVITAVICFLLYFNTFNNEYALDDDLVIVKNEFVHDGFAGIPDILKNDSYESYNKQVNGSNQLAGGRYRPLSIITFAIEQQLSGNTGNYIPAAQKNDEHIDTGLAHTRHVINVLLYIASIIALLYFLRTIIFASQPLTAFVAVLIFAIHPIHTEVVANIKSRDEILSLLFICLSFIYAWKYDENKKIKHLAIALASYFLALLSKEYAATLIILIPLMFYIFRNYTLSRSIKSVIPFLVVFIIYLFIRLSIVPLNGDAETNDIIGNPYLYASSTQRIATIILTQLNYMRLLFFPHPLSSDYSYAQIPYTNFYNPFVWLSVLVYMSLTAAAFVLVKKRHVIGFALAFFLLNWILISNLFFNIGATMGERLIYHSSVGFAIIIAWILYKMLTPTTRAKQIGVAAVMLIVTILCGLATINRNKDWKNNLTLYAKDIETSPNSAMLNSNIGSNYAVLSDDAPDEDKKNELLRKAMQYWSKAISINPQYILPYINRASAHQRLGEYDLAIQDLDTVRKNSPHFPNLPYMFAFCYFENGAHNYAKKAMYTEAAAELEKAINEEPNNPRNWYFLGTYYAALKDYNKSLNALSKAMQLSPNDAPLQKYYDSIKSINNR